MKYSMKENLNKTTKRGLLLLLIVSLVLTMSACSVPIGEIEIPLEDIETNPTEEQVPENQSPEDVTPDENQGEDENSDKDPAPDSEPESTDSPEDSGKSEENDTPDSAETGDDTPEEAPSSDMPPSDTETIQTLDADDGNLLVVINKQYAISDNYYPSDMVTIDKAYGTYTGMKIKKVAYDAYLNMLSDAREEGLDFYICSAYRSYDLQKDLYLNSYYSNGADYTNKMFAYPGKSEHHTGLAIDITSASMGWGLKQNYTDYPDGAWITEHCAEYGFIIRYLKGKEDITGYMYEPWHIRYVGVDVAKEIMSSGITLEEYLGLA